MNPKIILANTYHLAVQPGTEVVDTMGGIHEFMDIQCNLLTDSGGFQMVSLLELAHITEEGVNFRSHVDGKEIVLTPEMSIAHQNRIGGDIIMQLDDVVCDRLFFSFSLFAPPFFSKVSSVADDYERYQEATHRTVRWLDRCIEAHSKPNVQNLFAIVQGGLDVSEGGLREQCLHALIERDLPGYAIGGVAGGEDKQQFWRVVDKVFFFLSFSLFFDLFLFFLL